MSIIIIFVLYAIFFSVACAFLGVLSRDIPRFPRPMVKDTRPAPMATRKGTFHA